MFITNHNYPPAKRTGNRLRTRTLFALAAFSTLTTGCLTERAMDDTRQKAKAATINLITEQNNPADRLVELVEYDWLDTQDKQAVLSAFEAAYATPEPDMQWTGSYETCEAGDIYAESRAATLERLNYFRAMAGVPADTVNSTDWDDAAQATAMLLAEAGKITHYPTAEEFNCYTTESSKTANQSNLYIGRTGEYAIDGFIKDYGSTNTSVGHRNWLLDPMLNKVGIGQTPGDDVDDGHINSSIIKVIDNPNEYFSRASDTRSTDGMVAWPPEGFVPAEIVYPRWSISAHNINFENSTVTMTLENGQNIPLNIVHADGTHGSPHSILVWEPEVKFEPNVDTPVTVTINNFNDSQTRTYNVVIIGESTGIEATVVN